MGAFVMTEVYIRCMRKKDAVSMRIKVLACLHRYGWIAAMLGCTWIWPEEKFLVFGMSFIAFSVWSYVGYKYKWKHIYCSYQNAYHQKMTPHAIHWQQFRKSDVYGVPLIFFIFGLALLMMWAVY